MSTSGSLRRAVLAVVVSLAGLAGCSSDTPAEAHASVTRTTQVAPGDVCPLGGVRVESGVDDDDDRVLDDAEVETVDYVCNGVNGITPIVVVTPEPAGEHCPLGGQRIESGLDANGDHALDPGERTSVAWICSVERALVHLTPEPPGPNCAGGGLRIDAGVDDDRDAILDAAEIDSTAYQCVLLSCADDTTCGPFGFCISGFCYTDPALLCGSALPDDTRPCERSNGYGTCAGLEVCDGTYWIGCTAATPAQERCGDAIDDDCDGLTDAADTCVTRACTDAEVDGALACVEGCGSNPSCQIGCLTGVGPECTTALTSLYMCMLTSSCTNLSGSMERLACAAERCPAQTEVVFGPGGPAICAADAVEACGSDVGACVAGTRTCDAVGHWGACDDVGPGVESCNSIDDDCNGLVDDNPVAGGGDFFLDHDGDGWGSDPIVACGVVIGHPDMTLDIVDVGGDCDDWEPSIHPGAAPLCAEYVDLDCNGTLDYLEVPGCTAGVCGDAWCDAALGESPSTCREDCGSCGDGLCSWDYGEDGTSCLADCLASCGDGSCDTGLGEGWTNCWGDCPAACADGVCSPEYGETVGNCAADCAECGDGVCTPEGGENANTCAPDCSQCGDGMCTGPEDASSCLADCPAACGDGFCTLEAGEDWSWCPVDCPAVCDDGLCQPEWGENSGNCPTDCP